MGEQRNLTEENVEELRAALNKMKITNPDLEYSFSPQQEMEKVSEDLSINEQRILNKLEEIERKLDMIFGGHVLIDGKFQHIL